jgi:septal ring factor EnvC (AmiA/AmiB activator)
MTAATTTVTNEDLLGVIHELMQMTSEGFERLEKRIGNVELELRAIQTKLHEHDLQLAELIQITQKLSNDHSAYMNDINDILDRVTALEGRAPNISPAEVREMQRLLQLVVDWALKAAHAVKVPLNIGH